MKDAITAQISAFGSAALISQPELDPVAIMFNQPRSGANFIRVFQLYRAFVDERASSNKI